MTTSPYEVRHVKKRNFSLVDLLLHGHLHEEDFEPGGNINEQSILRAERQMTDFIQRRPDTAGPMPRDGTTVNQVASRRRRPRSTSSESRRVGSGNASHVDHVRLRRHLSATTGTQVSNTSSVDILPGRMELDACCVCYARRRDHVLRPCFHVCVCGACAQRVTRCPLCRESISHRDRVFLS